MEEIIYFGTPLVKYLLNQEMLDEINDLSDQLIKKENLPTKYDFKHRLLSAVNKEFRFPIELTPQFKAHIIGLGKSFHEKFHQLKFSSKQEVKLLSMWVVSQRESEWNYLHSHSGSISGILYLKIPENMGEGLSKDDKRSVLPGGISFVDGSSGDYRRSSLDIRPKVGELYLFPSGLMHTVYPFFGQGERRSLSFNLIVD